MEQKTVMDDTEDARKSDPFCLSAILEIWKSCDVLYDTIVLLILPKNHYIIFLLFFIIYFIYNSFESCFLVWDIASQLYLVIYNQLSGIE